MKGRQDQENVGGFARSAEDACAVKLKAGEAPSAGNVASIVWKEAADRVAAGVGTSLGRVACRRGAGVRTGLGRVACRRGAGGGTGAPPLWSTDLSRCVAAASR
jgi:hypothetical protein